MPASAAPPYHDMSALDNVTLGMRFTRDSKQVRQRKAKAMLSRLGLGHVAGDKIMDPLRR